MLRYEEDFPVPEINDDEILVRNKYAGINFIESYFRTGLYPSEKPYVLGREATGVVAQIGSKVTNFEVGDKVAYLSANTFAQYTKYSANGKIFKLPLDADDETMAKFAGSLINGLTCLTLIDESYHVKLGDYILVHAVAGGCGLWFTQLIESRGAHVIGCASTKEKLQLAKEYGAEYLINSKEQDIVEEVMKITEGKGVAAVYDGVGKATFDISIDSLARKGTFVSFGNASGALPPFLITKLTPKNLKLLRPMLFNYLASDEEWEKYSSQLRDEIANGIKVNITKTFPLSEYKEATTLLESGTTTGKLVLSIP